MHKLMQIFGKKLPVNYNKGSDNMAIGNLSIDDKSDINRINNIIGNTDISTSIIGGGVILPRPLLLQ